MLRHRRAGSSLFIISEPLEQRVLLSIDLAGLQLIGSGADITAVAADRAGNLYVTGRQSKGIDIPTGYNEVVTLLPASPPSASHIDLFVVKLSPSNQYVWAKSFGGTSGTEGHCITVAPDGTIMVGGKFSGTVKFDPGNPATTVSADQGAFALHLDPRGKVLGAYAVSNATFNSVAIDSGGNAFWAGKFYGTADFDPGPGQELRTSDQHINNSVDGFLLKVSSQGVFSFVRTFGGPNYDEAVGVGLDTQNNDVVVAGHFTGKALLGNRTLTGVNNSRDVFLARFTADGVQKLVRQYGGKDTDECGGLAVAHDRMIVAGQFRATMTVGTTTLKSRGLEDGFIIKTDGAGQALWARRFGGANPTIWGFAGVAKGDNVAGVAVDGAGSILVGGFVQGPADFGSLTVTRAGAFFAKYDKNGTALSVVTDSRRADTQEFLGSQVNALTARPAGGFAAAGSFSQTLNFGYACGQVLQADKASGVGDFVVRVV